MRLGRLLCCIVVGVWAGAVGCRQPVDGVRPEGFDGQHRHRSEAEWRAYQARLESPQRSQWQEPGEVVAALELHPGERVADIGAGTGYFTIRVAEEVGPTGRVYAVDVARQMIEYVSERAGREGLEQIVAILAPSNDPSLPAGGVDTVLMVNTYHHLDDRVGYLSRLERALASGGRIVVIDFVPKSKEERGFGPPLGMQIPREQVDREMAAAGFVAAGVHDFLPEQYFVEYRRRGE